jgi:hypothetical protein
MNRFRMMTLLATTLLAAGFGRGAKAQLTTFSGDASAEAAWQAAAGGSVPIETFESFHGTPDLNPTGDPIVSLPGLHVSFDGPPYPGAYDEPRWAHSGVEQWSNFGAGAANSSPHTMRVAPGYAIYALGFWNCDPQGDQPMNAYDFNGHLVGTITAQLNSHQFDPAHSTSFAGFVSTVPIHFLSIPGTLGDGWNHFDDLQVSAKPIPEPGTITLALIAAVVCELRRACRR